MKQPKQPNSNQNQTSQTPATSPATSPVPSTAKKQRLPRAEDVLAHYESQGLDTRDAAIKAVTELQSVLYKSIASGNKVRSSAEPSRRLDNITARLSMLEAKIDSKPGVPECFAICIASGAVIGGVGAVVPHVIGGIANIWSSVRAATRS